MAVLDYILTAAKPVLIVTSSELIKSVLSTLISFAISPTVPHWEGDASSYPVGALPSTDGEPTVIVRYTSSRILDAAQGCRCGDKIPYRNDGVATSGAAACGN